MISKMNPPGPVPGSARSAPTGGRFSPTLGSGTALMPEQLEGRI